MAHHHSDVDEQVWRDLNEAVSDVFARIIEKHGPDSVMSFVGALATLALDIDNAESVAELLAMFDGRLSQTNVELWEKTESQLRFVALPPRSTEH